MTHATYRRRRLSIISMLSLALAVATWLGAQEPGVDPFGDMKEAPKAAAPVEKKAAAEPVETDPVILSIRESRPETAPDVFQAALNVLNYGRPDEAKRYIVSLLNGGLEDAALWRLQRQFGTAPFIRLTRQEDVQPEGKQLADLVLAGANRFARDPARLNSLIKQLTDPAPEVRHAALVDLREAHEDAVVALILVLADPSRSAEFNVVKGALRQMAAIAVGPLRGSLDSPDQALRAQIIAVLGSLQTREAIPFLLRPFFTASPGSLEYVAAETALRQMLSGLPTKKQAEQFLQKETLAYLNGRLPGTLDHENRIALWRWDETQKRPIQVRLDEVAAPLLFAERLGGELSLLAPENRDYQILHLVAVLESAKFAVGWDNPLPQDAGTAFDFAAGRIDLLEDTLKFAVDHQHVGAAIAALEVIGAKGTDAFLYGTSGQPRELAKAMRNPDRRIRFAAMQTVCEIAPNKPFAGASFLPETLAYFSSTAGTRRVLIAHPRLSLAQSLAGIFLEIGMEADVTASGSEAFQMARNNSDYEFVFLSDALDQPSVQEQIQRFRFAPVTSELPIGILARSENLDRLTRIVEHDPLTEVFAHPNDVAGASFAVRQLIARAGRDFVPHEVRLRQASIALQQWAFFAEHAASYGFYDLISPQTAALSAFEVPELSADAAKVLGVLGSTESQHALIDVINQSGRPLTTRQAAAAAFDTAVRRRGILLTTSEIQRQYDVYNQSATADAGTQAVLSAVLDSIESAHVDSETPLAQQ